MIDFSESLKVISSSILVIIYARERSIKVFVFQLWPTIEFPVELVSYYFFLATIFADRFDDKAFNMVYRAFDAYVIIRCS